MACRRLSLVCSNDYTLCINVDGNVLSCGNSFYGAHENEEKQVSQLKIISSLTKVNSLSTGLAHSVCVDFEGNIFTFGSNVYGQLEINADRDTLRYTYLPQKVNLPPCKQGSCGNNFTICLTEEGELYSFGYNASGQLGIGNNESYYNSPRLIPSLKDVDFV